MVTQAAVVIARRQIRVRIGAAGRTCGIRRTRPTSRSGQPHQGCAGGRGIHLYTGLRAFIENGTNITAVDAIGSAANSSLLLQISADVWGVPVTRLNLVDEATALGAAVVGGVGVGIFDSVGIAQSLSRQIATHAPDERRHARYMAEYELFLEAYQRLEPWFDKL